MPKVEKRILPPFTEEDLHRLMSSCTRWDTVGLRDYAILLSLVDSGLRAEEFCSLKVGDLNMGDGTLTVRGKGGKYRQVRLGAKARGAIARMLAARQKAEGSDVADEAPLWPSYGLTNRENGALRSTVLRQMLQRLGDRANVHPCSPHRFRRTFALMCLRAGMDLHSLRLLMGHSDLQILQRYLALDGSDAARAHEKFSPGDRL
jgi:site-specific recombinase XerD